MREAEDGFLAKSMDEATLKQVAAVIASRRVSLSYEEARALALRAREFKIERGRAPEITSPDAWEKKMAEGVIALARYAAEGARG